MSKSGKKTFGSLVRHERTRLKIGLREMARRIGVSPTYLSMIERGKFPPPAEDKITAIAQIIGVDRDELLALAGRVSSDLQAKIMEQPRMMAELIRDWEGMQEKLSEVWGSLSAAKDAEFKQLFSRSPSLSHIAKLSSGRKPRKKAGPSQV